MTKPIKVPCDNIHTVNGNLTFLTIEVKGPNSLTHFKIQDHDLNDILNFILDQQNSLLFETFLSNKESNINPITFICNSLSKIIVAKENASVYNINIESILNDGSIFNSSYSFITPFYKLKTIL